MTAVNLPIMGFPSPLTAVMTAASLEYETRIKQEQEHIHNAVIRK